MASSRSAGYTTSGRGHVGKSSAVKKPAPVKKAAPAPKKSAKPAGKSKSSFPSSSVAKLPERMSVPGQAKPASGASARPSMVPEKSAAKKGIPAFGRDRVATKSRGVPGSNRQEGEARSMSEMFRSRLGPGQR